MCCCFWIIQREGADHESGTLTAGAQVQAPVELLHHSKEGRCHQHIEAAQSAGAAGLLGCPLWAEGALQKSHCLGIGCSQQVKACEGGNLGVPVLVVAPAVLLRLWYVEPLVLQKRMLQYLVSSSTLLPVDVR